MTDSNCMMQLTIRQRQHDLRDVNATIARQVARIEWVARTTGPRRDGNLERRRVSRPIAA